MFSIPWTSLFALTAWDVLDHMQVGGSEQEINRDVHLSLIKHRQAGSALGYILAPDWTWWVWWPYGVAFLSLCKMWILSIFWELRDRPGQSPSSCPVIIVCFNFGSDIVVVVLFLTGRSNTILEKNVQMQLVQPKPPSLIPDQIPHLSLDVLSPCSVFNSNPVDPVYSEFS